MSRPDYEQILKQTLDDHRLSRSEKRALKAVIGDERPSDADRAVIRSAAFALARAEITDPQSVQVIEWLEDVVKAVSAAGRDAADQRTADCCFTPNVRATARLVGLIGAARSSLDVCVFTITDDRIAAALAGAHRKGIAVRIITDDDKAGDRGSDVPRLVREGIPLRMDRTRHHMHHKFAIIDGRLLVTGSYNWTRSAASSNHENYVIVDDPKLVEPFAHTFDQLWKEFA